MQYNTKKIIAICLCFLLFLNQAGFAQVAGPLDISGYFSRIQPVAPDSYRPLHLRYIAYNSAQNSFKMFLDKGEGKKINKPGIQEASKSSFNYFLVGISLPDSSFWVNLRPDSPDNIIDENLGRTDVGRILLEADLQLKKDTARFTSPASAEGKIYWDRLYKKAGELYGAGAVNIPTLIRPWILPDEIIVREAQDNAYIYKATLKVMLEQDYLKDSAVYNFKDEKQRELNEYAAELVRQLILPKLIKEINTSQRYSELRQVYYSLILAFWFKNNFSRSNGNYAKLINSARLEGLISKKKWQKETFFKEYQESFNNGEYSLREQVSSVEGQFVRTYFSGGIGFGGNGSSPISQAIEQGKIIASQAMQPPIASDKLVGLQVGSGGMIGIDEVSLPSDGDNVVSSPLAASSYSEGVEKALQDINPDRIELEDLIRFIDNGLFETEGLHGSVSGALYGLSSQEANGYLLPLDELRRRGIVYFSGEGLTGAGGRAKSISFAPFETLQAALKYLGVIDGRGPLGILIKGWNPEIGRQALQESKDSLAKTPTDLKYLGFSLADLLREHIALEERRIAIWENLDNESREIISAGFPIVFAVQKGAVAEEDKIPIPSDIGGEFGVTKNISPDFIFVPRDRVTMVKQYLEKRGIANTQVFPLEPLILLDGIASKAKDYNFDSSGKRAFLLNLHEGINVADTVSNRIAFRTALKLYSDIAQDRQKQLPHSSSPIEHRNDIERRTVINTIVRKIQEKAKFDSSIREIVGKTSLGHQDLSVIAQLGRRLVLFNSLVALERQVYVGDVVVVFNQPNIKFLNTQLNTVEADKIIEERQNITQRLMAQEGLITNIDEQYFSVTDDESDSGITDVVDENGGILLLSYKQDKFVVKSKLLKEIGSEEVKRRLERVASRLSNELTRILHDSYPAQEEVRRFRAIVNFGMSLPVLDETEDAKIIADQQALIAAKLVRRSDIGIEPGELGFLFDQGVFDRLMREAVGLREQLGLGVALTPPEPEMLAVRGVSEEDLSKGADSGSYSHRKYLLKKYLDIIDLLDYPKSWRGDPLRRKEERDHILRILEEFKTVSLGRAPPSRAIQEAMDIINSNPKNHLLVSSESFMYYADRYAGTKGGRVIACDAMGFWGLIQKNLAEAHLNYLKSIDKDEVKRREAILKESLDADDKVKQVMAGKVRGLISLLRHAIPVVADKLNISGRLLVNLGGDEIVVFLPGDVAWQPLAEKLAGSGLNMRMVASEINRADSQARKEADLIAILTEVTHEFGKTFVSAMESDKKSKELESFGINEAIVSEEINPQGVPEWFVYYKVGKGGVKRVGFDQFKRDALIGRIASPHHSSSPIEFAENEINHQLVTRIEGLRSMSYPSIELSEGFDSGVINAIADLLHLDNGIEGERALLSKIILDVNDKSRDEHYREYVVRFGASPGRKDEFSRFRVTLSWLLSGEGMEFNARQREGAEHVASCLNELIDRLGLTGSSPVAISNSVSESIGAYNAKIQEIIDIVASSRTGKTLVLINGNQEVGKTHLRRDLQDKLGTDGIVDEDRWPMDFPIDEAKSSAMFNIIKRELDRKQVVIYDGINSFKVYQSVKELLTKHYRESGLVVINLALSKSRNEVRPDIKISLFGNDPGGIDFRSMPIKMQRVPVLSASAITYLDKTARIKESMEWKEIDTMLKAGMIPSVDRIKEYILNSCGRTGFLNEAGKVTLWIADILRIEEERCLPTDQVMRQMLVLLESGRGPMEVRNELKRIRVVEREPQAVE